MFGKYDNKFIVKIKYIFLNHIICISVHIPPELLDELQATSSQWDDGGRSSIMDSGGYIGALTISINYLLYI